MYVCECECVGVCVADTEPGPSLPAPPSADAVRATVQAAGARGSVFPKGRFAEKRGPWVASRRAAVSPERFVDGSAGSRKQYCT